MDHVGFSVRDVKPILERLAKVGVTSPIVEFDNGSVRLTFIEDPDGVWIEFLSYNEKGRKRRKGRPCVRGETPPGTASAGPPGRRNDRAAPLK